MSLLCHGVMTLLRVVVCVPDRQLSVLSSTDQDSSLLTCPGVCSITCICQLLPLQSIRKFPLQLSLRYISSIQRLSAWLSPSRVAPILSDLPILLRFRKDPHFLQSSLHLPSSSHVHFRDIQTEEQDSPIETGMIKYGTWCMNRLNPAKTYPCNMPDSAF